MNTYETEIQNLKTEHRLALSRISHEIRNPVTMIHSSMQIIEKEHPEVTDFAYWSDMKADMLYLRHLLDEVSGFNNCDRLQSEETDTSFYLSEIASGAKALTDDPHITYLCEIEPDLPPISIDPTKIRQAVTNLLRNAFESGASHVSFQASLQEDSIILKVTDDGCGIPKEAEKNLFTPFVTHKKNGTGLGLSIVSRIVQAHNGQLTYSTGNSGTCFSLILPINTTDSNNPATMPPKCAI